MEVQDVFYSRSYSGNGCNLISCAVNPNPPPTGTPSPPFICPPITPEEICKYQGQWVYFWTMFKDQNGNDVHDDSYCLVQGVIYNPFIGDFVLHGCIEDQFRRRFPVIVPLSRINCFFKYP